MYKSTLVDNALKALFSNTRTKQPKVNKTITTKNNAATTIQKHARGYKNKRVYNKLRKQTAATTIQKHARGKEGRSIAVKEGRLHNTPYSRMSRLNQIRRGVLNKKVTQRKYIPTSTASCSNVYSFRTSRNSNIAVMKRNPCSRLVFVHEYNMYKYFNNFVKYRVTPYVLQSVDVNSVKESGKQVLYTQSGERVPVRGPRRGTGLGVPIQKDKKYELQLSSIGYPIILRM